MAFEIKQFLAEIYFLFSKSGNHLFVESFFHSQNLQIVSKRAEVFLNVQEFWIISISVNSTIKQI